MLKLPDLSAPSLNLTAHALNIGGMKSMSGISIPPKIRQIIPEQNKNNKPIEGWGRIGRHPDRGASFRRLTSSWTLGGPDGFF
jgi:hypothetical protein